MGHRLSKTTATAGSNADTIKPTPTINVIATNNQNLQFETATTTVHLPQPVAGAGGVAAAGSRRIIIKIQLTKMESGEIEVPTVLTTTSDAYLKSNATKLSGSPVLVNNNFASQCSTAPFIDEDEPSTSGCSSRSSSGNNNLIQKTVQQLSECSIKDDRQGKIETSSNVIVPDSGASKKEKTICRTDGASSSTMCGEAPDGKHHCCRRKKSSAYPSKWRCCKCACRHAVKKIIDNTSSRGSKQSKKDGAAPTSDLAMWSPPETPSTTPSSSSSTSPIEVRACHEATASAAAAAGNHVTIWTPVGAESPQIVVVQCPTSVQASQFVTVTRIEDFDERTRRLRALEAENGVDPLLPELESALSQRPWQQIQFPRQFLPNTFPAGMPTTATASNAGGGTVVHSQVDYIHCLVPDLEKITSSSFYWGKMDRYEAERLLEGKPEGTFLLRDSAQEEYLFSVTFRKYGRSLHARIEQFNHRFSFDCHDPGVFTAPTVTGLLEHYKDPSCVMFFEPMLAIPLNRNFSFSLQQLCRAKIVSSTTYDGIKELELPNSLKSYLKEYHYKMRVRVKPFDEASFYST